MILNERTRTQFDARAALARMLLLQALDRRLIAATESSDDPLVREVVLHPATGLEAVSAGLAAARRPGDALFASHRGYGHCIAWGADPDRTVAEVLGRSSGYGGGRAGHMHVVDVAAGVGGTNGIVGAPLPLALGAAFAFQRQGAGAVAVGCLGDGALNTGAFHESVNLAVVWRLPVVFLCEDNGFTEAMTSSEQLAADGILERARAYEIPARGVDGHDVEAVFQAVAEALAHARDGGGPSFVSCRVPRAAGHYHGDRQPYRDPAEAAASAAADPVARALAASGVDGGEAERLRLAAVLEAERIVVRALAAPAPDRTALLWERLGEPA